jgi:KipI family sensor histidine kinase inhibitor
MKPPPLEPLGDRAVLARFATEHHAGDWAQAVRERRWPGVTDVVRAYRSVAVFADPAETDLSSLQARLGTVVAARDSKAEGKRLVIPVLYDGADLPDVATRLQLTEPEVVELHSGVDFNVFAIGFSPGFPYAGYLPPALAGLPRRATPRVRVPAGSVAIAGRQTAIYPTESPGGWHLLGTTPLCIADPQTAYFPIQAGDRIRFQPITRSEFEERRDERLS